MASLLGVAANAGSWSIPCGRDSPGRNVIDERLPQQIGHSCRDICGINKLMADRNALSPMFEGR
jgi:hypothetical protein